jgi:flagellar assembly protein FliH
MKLRNGQADVTTEARAIPVQVAVPFLVAAPTGDPVDAEVTMADVEQLWSMTRAQCEELLSQTKEQAEERLRAVEVEAQAVRADARQQGYDDGFQQGVREAEEACQQDCLARIDAAEKILQRAQAERHRLLKDMYLPLATIGTQAVKAIIHRELLTQPAQVEGIVSDLLQYVTESTKVEVRVHPEDFLAATDAHPTWQSAKFGEWEVIVVPDVKISVGGCEIRSETGRVDATVETRLELLQETLMSVMERGVAQYAAAND